MWNNCRNAAGWYGIHAASGFWCCPSVYTHLSRGRVPIFVPLIGDVGDNRRANKLRRVASVFGSFICQATMGAGANTIQDWFSAKWAEKLWAPTINTPPDTLTPLHPTKLVLCSAPSVPQPVFTIAEKAPTRAFSWLKAPTSAFTFKTLLRHYAKRALTQR